METRKDIEKEKSFNNNQVYRMIAFFVAMAVYGTLVFAEFQYQKKVIQVLEERLDKKIKIQNSLEKRISNLEQKGSDSE